MSGPFFVSLYGQQLARIQIHEILGGWPSKSSDCTSGYQADSHRNCPGPIEGDRIEDVMAHHAEVEGKTIPEVRRAWESAAPMNRFVEPREVAAVMLFLCSADASAMTGQALNVTGGFLMT
jgi:hypothetical protein